MNGRTMVLMVFGLGMPSLVAAAYPPPPEGGGEAHDPCYVDIGPMNCSAAQNAPCLQPSPCIGHQFLYSGSTGNELQSTNNGGHLGDFVYERECFKYAPCILVFVAGGAGICGPDLFRVKTDKVASGHVNWDLPCIGDPIP